MFGRIHFLQSSHCSDGHWWRYQMRLPQGVTFAPPPPKAHLKPLFSTSPLLHNSWKRVTCGIHSWVNVNSGLTRHENVFLGRDLLELPNLRWGWWSVWISGALKSHISLLVRTYMYASTSWTWSMQMDTSPALSLSRIHWQQNTFGAYKYKCFYHELACSPRASHNSQPN